MFGRMLNDVPMFSELAVTDSENLPDHDRCSAFGWREADMKKHHVVLCYDRTISHFGCGDFLIILRE